MSLNGPNCTQITLNKPTWSQVDQNEIISALPLETFLVVIHVSERYEIC